jgi:WXG100 family type VII secretion target
MADGTITYDYGVIDECLEMMKKKAQEIQGQADDLADDVKRIMVDWKGTTADAYNSLASDLDQDLVANRENLDNLQKTFHESAQAMQQADSKGSQQF